MGLLWGVLLWKTIKRENRKRMPLRIFLLTLALVSLLAAGLRPFNFNYERNMTAILLSEGYGNTLLDSLKDVHSEALLFSAESIQGESEEIVDIDQLYIDYPQIDTLHVIGNGLSDYLLAQLEGRRFQLHLNNLPEGVIKFAAPKIVREGSSIPIAGIYNHRDTGKLRLELKSPYGYTTLLNTEESNQHTFGTTITAKQPGRYLFSVVKNDRSSTAETNQFPIIILPKKRYSALIINQVPSYENNYLKNWLADKGYEVAVRTEISRSKYKTEFFNRRAVDLEKLKTSLLNRFDVLVLSGNTFLSLTKEERLAIQQSVKRGLGLCLLGNEEFFNNRLTSEEQSFFLPFQLGYADPVIHLPEGWKGLKKKAELPAVSKQIEDRFGIFPLLEGVEDFPRVAFARQSLGRVTLSLLRQTYLLKLKGHQATYSAIWTEIMENVIRQDFVSNEWTVKEELISQPHHVINISLLSDESQPQGIIESPEGKQMVMPFQQAFEDAEKWSSQFWPKQVGWYQIRTRENKSDTEWVFVQSSESWQALRAANLLEKNQRWQMNYSLLSNQDLAKATQLRQNEKWSFPLWWFYLSFLLSAGLLWLEEKF